MTRTASRKRSVEHNEDVLRASTSPGKRSKLNDLDKMDGTRMEGLQRFLHGISYQLKLVILMLLHADKVKKADQTSEFKINCEDPSGGKFDDIVFHFKVEGIWSAVYIQTKHSASNAEYTWKNLTSCSSTAAAALGRYFRSFLGQKRDSVDTSRELVFCTNVGIAPEVKKLMVKYSFKSNVIAAIFQSLSANVLKFDVEKLGENRKQAILQHCEEHWDCVRLARKVAECIYNQKKIDFRNPMLKKYGKAIKAQIATDKLLQSSQTSETQFCINEEFLNELNDSDFKKAFEAEYRKVANSEVDVWEDVRQKGILLPKPAQYRFSTAQCDYPNLPSKVHFSEMENFMNSFVIVCNTKGERSNAEDSITGIILDMLKSSEHSFLPLNMQGSVEPELTHSALLNTLIDWINARNNETLESNDVVEIFNLFVTKLHYLNCKGISNAFIKKLEKMGLHFEPEKLRATRLYKTFHPWEQNSKVLVSSYHPVIVWQVLNLLEHEYIIVDGTTFTVMQDTIVDVFDTMQFPLVLVIDCKENPVNVDFHELFRGSALKSYARKVIVLQDTQNDPIDDDFSFGDLMEESQQMVNEQLKNLMLFGTSVSSQTVLSAGDSFTFYLECTDARDMLQMRQNLNAIRFERIKPFYIQRKWHSCDSPKKEKTGENVGIRKNVNVLSDLSDPKLVLADEPQRMCVVQLVEDITSGRRTTKSIYQENQKRVVPPGAIRSNTTKVHIFLNDAGQGKSFYMNWLAQDLQASHPSWWIIKINLIEYSTIFRMLAETQAPSVIDEQEALRILFQLTYLIFYAPNINYRPAADTDQERGWAKKYAKCLVVSDGRVQIDRTRLDRMTVASHQLTLLRVFEHKFNSKEIVVLFDGFDEIAPYYKEVGLSLLKGLGNLEGILKLYLTSRPYDLRKDFHAAMPGCRFIRLKKLWRDDKKQFVHRHLRNNFQNYLKFKPEVQNALMRLLTKLTDDLLGDLSCVPLFLSMALDTFVPLVIKHMNLEDCTIAPQVLKECESIFEQLRMMEIFVDKKLSIVCTEKTGTTETAAQTAAARGLAEDKLHSSKRVHALLGMYLLLSEEDRAILLSEGDREEALKYMQRVNDGSEKSGIVDGVVDNVPMFIHRSFAEYFAACWLFANKDREVVKSFIKRSLLENDLRMEIRHFLDRMVCNVHPLHMAVLDSSKMKVKNILEKDRGAALDVDEWGRTPLHLSVMYFRNHLDSKEVLDALVQAQKSSGTIDPKEELMGRTAMDYAFALGKDDHVKLHLLENGASVNTDTLLDRILTSDPVSTLCNAAIFENELMNLTEWCLSRTKANSLFERVAERLTALPAFDLYCRIPRAKLPEPLPKAMLLKMKRLGKEEHNHGAFTLLKFCAVLDSAALLRNLVKRTNARKLAKCVPSLFEVAKEYCSVHILQYLIIECKHNLPGTIKFHQLVRTLMFCIKENAMGLFKYLFDKYCTWYNVDCLQENELPAASANAASDEEEEEEEWVDSCDWLQLPDVPAEFQQTDRGMDTGTESLLIEAIEVNNLKATMHLIEKARLVVTNAFIISLFTNYKIGWYCERGVHFLLDRARDLRGNDETSGRNLLHHAAQNGWFCLAKCLIEHYQFDGKQINERENDWNAFFYCVSENGSKYGSQKILTFMMERYAADCFHQKDKDGRNVFYYAVKNNRPIAEYILQHKCEQLADLTPNEKSIALLQLMRETGLANHQIKLCVGWLAKLLPNAICRNTFDSGADRVDDAGYKTGTQC